jgi:hypothetical protein
VGGRKFFDGDSAYFHWVERQKTARNGYSTSLWLEPIHFE